MANVNYKWTVEYDWSYNQFNVNLILNRTLNSLHYRIKDTAGTNLLKESHFNLGENTVSQKIESLKKLQATINDDKKIKFIKPISGWDLDLEKCKLNEPSLKSCELRFFYVKKSSQWYIAFSNEKINKTMPFSKAFIPSKRCSPEVRNIIGHISAIDGKVMKKTSVEILLRETILKEFTVRVVNKESIESELTENAKKRDLKIQENSKLAGIDGARVILGASAVYTSATSIVTATIATSAFLGGGFLAVIPAGLVGFYTGAFTFVIGSLPAIIAADLRLDLLKENKKIEDAFERENAPKLKPEEFLVEIEPISKPSQIDSRVRVSKFMWAVMIVTGPSGESQSHSAIIIEGLANSVFRETITDIIPNGECFIFRTEIDPPIKFSFLTEKEYKKDLENGMERTEIWMKSSDKVIEMLKHAFEEKEENSEKHKRGEPLKFNTWGKNSIIGNQNQIGGHSCFTWSREKVAMLDIHLGKNWYEKILVHPRSFTKPAHFYENKPFSIEL